MLPLLGGIVVLAITVAAWLARRMASARARLADGGAPGWKRAAPVVGGDEAQDRAYRDYPKLRMKAKAPSFESFCWPKAFHVQKQQLFAAEYMAPEGDAPKEMLVYHLIGAGKSCLSIRVGLKYLRPPGSRRTPGDRPMYVMPASLEPGFRNELRGKCADDRYISEDERTRLAAATPGSDEYLKIIKASDARIDADFQIYSYNKFMEISKEVDAPIIIVDEVQNVNNPTGVCYKDILEWIRAHPRAATMMMSGTPIFDHVTELDSLAPLLRIDPPLDEHGKPRPITPSDIPLLFKGKVSYYAGAPACTFPTTTVRVRRVRMSRHQAHWYHSEVAAEMKPSGDIRLNPMADNFYVKSRRLSNIAFPKGLSNEAGLAALTPALIRTSLSTYSAKFAAVIRKLRAGALSFIYTGFTGVSGIEGLTKCLRAFGWKDFATHGPGRRRYAVWSGDETSRQKDIIRATFNSAKNDDGSQIRVIIGSPSIKEGVSLLRVRVVHVLEAYWNHSRLAQIFGRAVRYCSHKTLSEEERTVDIIIYASTAGSPDTTDGRTHVHSPVYSVDLYMLDMADKKRAEAEPYINELVKVAVDRYLWYGKKQAKNP